MKKGLLIVSLMVIALFAIGCEKALEEAMEAKIESETGENVEVDIDSGSMTVETDDGTLEVTSSGLGGDGWCEDGAEWSMASTGVEGTANAQWMIEGLMTSGDYQGLCHVVYTSTSPEGDARMDYYFAEDGETGYFEMNVNGQVMKSEWHK
jgi:hypothetical protein